MLLSKLLAYWGRFFERGDCQKSGFKESYVINLTEGRGFEEDGWKHKKAKKNS